jgi:FkbM family methyltransferase
MDRHVRFHRLMRAVCANYVLPFGDDWINNTLDRFFHSRGPNWLLAPGHGQWPTMVLNVADNLQRKFYYFPRLHGWYYRRSELGAYLHKTLTAGSTFLDIGSNVGFYSLMAARLVGPGGRVVAFDPDPDCCESLTRSAGASSFNNVEAIQLALSDKNTEQTFYRAKYGTAHSLLREAPGREGRYSRELSVRVRRLDDLVSEGRLEPDGIRVVKIDVEGEEARTVAGMRRTLVASRHPSIWCEVRGPAGSTRAPNTFVEVRDTLAELGYRPYLWSGGKMQPVAEGSIVKRADVLFERG